MKPVPSAPFHDARSPRPARGARRLVAAAAALTLSCAAQRNEPLPPETPAERIKAPLPSAGSEPGGGQLWSSFGRPDSLAPERWLVLGPFDNEVGEQGVRAGLDRDFLQPLGGEANARIATETTLDGGKRKVALARADARGIVDLAALFGQGTDLKLAYAYGTLESPRAQVVLAHFGSDDGAAIWLNGARVHRISVDRGVEPGADRFELPLVAGENRLLVKVENGLGGWAFALALYDRPAQERLEALALRQHLEWFEPGPEDRRHLLETEFPALSWRRPKGAQRVFGGQEPRVRWFGPTLEEVTRPDADGRYIALVEAETLDGFTYRHMTTFAKVPERTLPWFPVPPGSEPEREVPLPAGLSLNTPQRAELSRHILAAGGRGIWEGEHSAILANALYELRQTPNTSEPRWLASSFIRNAEQQLALRMKLEGREPRPLAKPERLARPAPRLRAGGEVEAGMKPGTVARLRKLAQAWAAADANGFVVLVARRGIVFMHEGFNGFTRDSTFYPASVGKTVAGLLFARAVDRGLLGFDTPLSAVFPEFANAQGKLPERTAELTFRHCFLHVAGLSAHRSHGGLYNPYLDNSLLISDIAFSEPLASYVYNGDDLNLAGKALELTTGQSIFRLLYEQLQEPFGEPVTQFDLGAGDRFNAMYLAELGQLLVQDGAYGDRRLFSPGFVKQLWPGPIAERVPGFADPKLEAGIGLNWMTDPPGPRDQGVLGPNVVGHAAASGVTWRIAPDHELVIVVGRNHFNTWQSNEAWAAKFAAEVARGLPEPRPRATLTRR